jgi:aminopeptidase N
MRFQPLRAGALVMAAILVGCDAAPPPPVELGIPWELARHRKRTIQELEYAFDLEVPADREEPVRGRADISFRWDDPRRHDVVLDFMRPLERVERVRANGADVAWQAVDDHIVIPASALERGGNRVEVEFAAGDDALNRNDEFLYTLFVPDRAHFSLPVFDQPDLKAPVSWTLRLPAQWKALANAPLVEASPTLDGATLRFAPSRPLPTYLFAFVAGEFSVEEAVLDGRSMTMLHRETDAERMGRNRGEIFRLHADALAWLEEYTGIPYPFDSFAFALVPAFQYGGMEHPGAILYNAPGLVLDETATQAQILGRASLIAHETAHMWFGNLVTMAWFDDVWTKEVFANFMASKIVHPSFPDVDHDLRFLMAHHPAAYGVDRTAGANPIRQPLENLREAGTLYGAIIYQKAPVVMRQLEALVGPGPFQEGVREYLVAHAYGNATWSDLIRILDARTPGDLAEWSRVWVEEAGRPTVSVARDGEDAVLAQHDPAGKGRVWPQTLAVRLGREAGDTLVTVALGTEPVRIPGGGGPDVRFVLPNGSGSEYGLFLLDDASLEYLVTHLPALGDALARGAAWVTLWDHLLEGRLHPQRFLDLALSALPAEEDELNVARVLGYLGTTWWSFLPHDARAGQAPRVEETLWSGVAGRRPATARSAFLGAWRTVALTPSAVARMERLWRGTETVAWLPLSENDQTALAAALALREAPGWEAILEEQEGRITNPDRKARFRFVRPALDADPRVRLAFFDSLRDPANRAREPWVLSGLEYVHHPLRATTALPAVVPALEMVEEIQRTGDIFFPGRWLDATLGGHNSVEAAQAVHDFLRRRPDLPPRLRGKVLQSADGVWRAAHIVHGWNQP